MKPADFADTVPLSGALVRARIDRIDLEITSKWSFEFRELRELQKRAQQELQQEREREQQLQSEERAWELQLRRERRMRLWWWPFRQNT